MMAVVIFFSILLICPLKLEIKFYDYFCIDGVIYWACACMKSRCLVDQFIFIIIYFCKIIFEFMSAGPYV